MISQKADCLAVVHFYSVDSPINFADDMRMVLKRNGNNIVKTPKDFIDLCVDSKSFIFASLFGSKFIHIYFDIY